MLKTTNENADSMMGSFGAITKGTQAIATEMADYSRRSFENGTKTMQSLLSAKSLDKAVEVQSEYARSEYEGYVTLATSLAKSAQI